MQYSRSFLMHRESAWLSSSCSVAKFRCTNPNGALILWSIVWPSFPSSTLWTIAAGKSWSSWPVEDLIARRVEGLITSPPLLQTSELRVADDPNSPLANTVSSAASASDTNWCRKTLRWISSHIPHKPTPSARTKRNGVPLVGAKRRAKQWGLSSLKSP